MTEKLTEVEARVIGSLIEKQLTTPEYYPLTLNALTAACNQKTNREPVVFYEDETVTKALDHLREKNLVYVFYGSTSRVPKYKHIFQDYFELEPSGVAVMCVLMLRGAQTLGEIRERTKRLYDFRDFNDVNETLDALINRDEPLIIKLDRQAGQKEARFAQLLCGEVIQPTPAFTAHTDKHADNERVAKLETELENLKAEFESFRQDFEAFKKQFE
jgi:uncharacterized protein